MVLSLRSNLMEKDELFARQLTEQATRTEYRGLTLGTAPVPAALLLPRSQGDGNFFISGDARVHLGDNHTHNKSDSEHDIQQKLLTSLSFPQMRERGHQISATYPGTYQWMLEPLGQGSKQWDCFRTWVDQPGVAQGIYWIQGKPGSGKSTIMKFLHNNLTAENHMFTWANGQSVIKAQYFFWNSGSVLEKSLKGLCRYLLVQILEQRPDLTDTVMLIRERTSFTNYATDWSRTELSEALLTLVQSLSTSSKLLLLVDGLDECETKDVDQEELIDLLTKISEFHHVKVCISSRPWNLFKDAFVHCPQLRLENLTRIDIQIFVESRLRTSRRWRFFEDWNRQKADDLIKDIISRAEGVFLWVILVVRDILRDLRDGDGLDELLQKLYQVPADLDDYFMRIIESVEPHHRREASVLLQLALHEEDQFESVFSLRLVDIFFISERHENFAAASDFNVHCLNFKDEQAIFFLADSAQRKVNSRCKGLLECIDGDSWSPSTRFHGYNDNFNIKSHLDYSERLSKLFKIHVGFLHRSLRDFLLLSSTQAVLHQYTGGRPFASRVYLSSARIVQLMALSSIEDDGDLTVGTASHILSALQVNRLSHDSALMAMTIQDAVERLAMNPHVSKYWYINESFDTWYEEQSNFLSLAIDFRLTSYVLNYMTRRCIREKSGRPILDYILRPRFTFGYCAPGNRCTDPELLRAALSCGADPNERVGDNGPSIWALYLCFLADFLHVLANGEHNEFATMDQLDHFHAMSVLVSSNVAPVLPVQWLASPGYFSRDPGPWGRLIFPSPWDTSESQRARFGIRWPDVSPVGSEHSMQKHNVVCRASDLVQSFACHFDFDIGSLVRELRSREQQTGTVIPA